MYLLLNEACYIELKIFWYIFIVLGDHHEPSQHWPPYIQRQIQRQRQIGPFTSKSSVFIQGSENFLKNYNFEICGFQQKIWGMFSAAFWSTFLLNLSTEEVCMTLYPKLNVKNGFANVFQFFSLISDGLGSVCRTLHPNSASQIYFLNFYMPSYNAHATSKKPDELGINGLINIQDPKY